MSIRLFKTYDEMSEYAAELVLGDLSLNPRLKLCAATGSSPLGTYRFLAEAHAKTPRSFKGLQLIKLDEWVGLPKEHPASCEHYIREHLIEPLKIADRRYIGFRTNPASPKNECKRIQALLEAQGPIDLCILGLGSNGHLGLNEPADVLRPFCHVAALSEQTKQHGMLQDLEQRPEFGMTLGMQNILGSKKIILLVQGTGKQNAFGAFRRMDINPRLPVSFLWLHDRVELLVMEKVAFP